ncbi:unnamed protein product [Hermetia illucens]|uniref:Uncharacterized protein n=1 Tax=Hermetia illucens TaxID=343691 RepID=A0A7R8UPX3_HERIL|nr:unnamed protein product [Hermetia illucens]
MASAVEDPTNNDCQSDDEGEIDGKFEEYMSKVDIIKCPGCLYESSAEEVRTHMKQTHFQQKYCNICEKQFSEWRGAHCLKHLLIAIISQLKEQCSNCSQLFMLDTKRSEEDNFTSVNHQRNTAEDSALCKRLVVYFESGSHSWFILQTTRGVL